MGSGLGARTALAQDSSNIPRLEWNAPAACPSSLDVANSLSVLLPPDTIEWQRFEVVRGRVTQVAAEWQLDLSFVSRGQVRRRVLHAVHCDDLADAAAVAIVLALSSDAGAVTTAPVEAASGGTGAAVPSARSPAASEPSPDPPHVDGAAPALRLEFGAEGLLDPSTLGSAAIGAGISARLRRGAFGVGLFATGFPARRIQVGPGEAIELGLWTSGLRGCYRVQPGLDTCIEGELGQVSAQAVNLREAQKSRDLWAAPGLSVEFASQLLGGVGLCIGFALGRSPGLGAPRNASQTARPDPATQQVPAASPSPQKSNHLRAGQPDQALALLLELDQRVPVNVLDEERNVTRALALCDGMDSERAASVARRVLAKNPDSVYALSLRDSCVGHEQLLEQMRRRASKP